MTSPPPRRLARIAGSALLALLGACVSPPPAVVTSDRVILLPQPDGSPSAVLVTTGAGQLLLDKPYAGAELRGGNLVAVQSDAETVNKNYGALLAVQPARPRRFSVQFEPNGSRLSAGADGVLAEMRAALATLPAAELIVTGHTDRVGTLEANDQLSLARAEAVRELLVGAGVARSAITHV